jgi:Mg2+ and Co2+ transporter CorA
MNNQQPATRKDLHEALNKQDKKWGIILDSALIRQDKKWDNTLNKALVVQDKKWDKKLNVLKQDIIKSTANLINDVVIPNLERIENKVDAINNRVDNHKDKLEDHEIRINSLEKAAVSL